jgi:DEAD/DEAH box helicase domain-containing protein
VLIPTEIDCPAGLAKTQTGQNSCPAETALSMPGATLNVAPGVPKSQGEIFLDLETQRLAREVQGGWGNIAGFGLALGVTWDREHGFRFWDEDEAEALVVALGSSPQVVGFNILRFDYQVLSAYAPYVYGLLADKTFDILADIAWRLGHRVSLNSVALATLGRKKISDGVQAVYSFRRGELGRVRAYCQEDVALTRDIYKYGQERRCVYYIDVNGKRRKCIPVQW